MKPTATYYRERLRENLTALKAHDAETRRLLDIGNQPLGTFDARRMERDDLVARVEVSAESLVEALS